MREDLPVLTPAQARAVLDEALLTKITAAADEYDRQHWLLFRALAQPFYDWMAAASFALPPNIAAGVLAGVFGGLGATFLANAYGPDASTFRIRKLLTEVFKGGLKEPAENLFVVAKPDA